MPGSERHATYCEVGDGRIASLNIWMPAGGAPAAAGGGMAVLRVGAQSLLLTGIQHLQRSRHQVRMQLRSGDWLELRTLASPPAAAL